MSKKKILLVIGLIVYVGIIIGVISYTYSYYTASATNTGVISGTAASYDLDVSVSKVDNSGTGDLIPQLDSTITKAIQGTNGTLCLDGNGNTVCQVYEISVENLSDANLVVYGYLDLNAGSNSNLKWAEVTGVSNPSLLSSYNSYTTTLLANGDDLEVYSINTYYVVIWISETGSSQSDTGDFSGIVTFSTEKMDIAKQTLVKLGLEDSVNDTTPDFNYTSQQTGEVASGYKCWYGNNEVYSFDDGEITEESCATIYESVSRKMRKSNDINSNFEYKYLDASTANYYVGTGTWDSTNSVCKYNNNIVKYVNGGTVIYESDCNDVYELDGVYYTNVREVGSGTIEAIYKRIFKSEDDLGTSYYFRGAVDNNWVYFAGIYWRIIRINGDGSIRMIYSGTTAPTSSQAVVMTGSGTQVGTSRFNDSDADNKYLGYTYNNNGTETDSTIKSNLDLWYEDTLLNTQYEQYLADAIYCNDREVSTNANLYTAWNTALGETILDVTSTTLGQGTTPTLYKSDERLGYFGGSVSPTLKCNQTSDKYTVSTSLGNGKLQYKVGLITADELVMAGAKDGLGDAINQTENTLNTSYYLYNGGNYWTLTPRVFFGGYAGTWYVFVSHLSLVSTGNSRGARPVVSLSSNVTISGNGTYSSPFTIQIPK